MAIDLDCLVGTNVEAVFTPAWHLSYDCSSFLFAAPGRMLCGMPNCFSDFHPDMLVVQGCQSRVAAHVPLASVVDRQSPWSKL